MLPNLSLFRRRSATNDQVRNPVGCLLVWSLAATVVSSGPGFCFPSAVCGQEAELAAPVEFCPGLDMADSLAAAKDKAQAESKLILLIPSSTRIDTEKGAFGPGLETLRAGALTDTRVVKLINRRFVPYLFDVDSSGERYDEAAAGILFTSIPEMKLATAMPTPPLLAVTVEGVEKGKVNIFLSASEMLSALKDIVTPPGGKGSLTHLEFGLENVEKAIVFYEIRQPELALEQIKDDDSPEANFLRGKIACEAGDWPAMKAAFSKIPDDRFAAEIEIHEIYRSWEIGNFEGIISRVAEIRASQNKFPFAAEAMWYAGLASYHSGNEPAALETWEQITRNFSDTLWGMKADRTRGLVKHGLNKPQMLNRHPESLLGKRYLSPFGVHELKRR